MATATPLIELLLAVMTMPPAVVLAPRMMC